MNTKWERCKRASHRLPAPPCEGPPGCEAVLCTLSSISGLPGSTFGSLELASAIMPGISQFNTYRTRSQYLRWLKWNAEKSSSLLPRRQKSPRLIPMPPQIIKKEPDVMRIPFLVTIDFCNSSAGKSLCSSPKHPAHSDPKNKKKPGNNHEHFFCSLCPKNFRGGDPRATPKSIRIEAWIQQNRSLCSQMRQDRCIVPQDDR